MGPNDIPGFDNAQHRYDMHYDQAEEFETEDDIPSMDDDEEQESYDNYKLTHG